MKSLFKIPKAWALSPQQELVIGSFLDEAGHHISTADFCKALYDEDCALGPAPAKLRVLIQRCRAIIAAKTNGRVVILGKRNSGWKITRKGAVVFRRFLDNQ